MSDINIKPETIKEVVMEQNHGALFHDKKINLDDECLDCIETNINLSVPWYLMASYAYYEEDDPIISDSMYDRLAKKILAHWDEIKHQHKHHLSVDMLEAGSYIGTYPSRVAGGLISLKETYYGKDYVRTHSRST